MAVDIVKYAFIAGELSPSLYGRSDLTRFDLGMAEAENFFVDYRGGLSTRPGTQFFEYIKEDDKPVRLFEFAFSSDAEDNNVIIFGHNYVRFAQEGNYILEAAKSCTTSTATPLVVTSTAHGLAAGRWIKVNGVSYEVQAPIDLNSFALANVPDGTDVDGSSLSFTSYQAVHEVATDYNGNDLAGIRVEQYRDRVRITSFDFPPTDLTRNDAADWSLAVVEQTNLGQGPTITGESLSDTGTAQTLFAVTKVLANGEESPEGPIYRLDGAVNYPVTEGSVSIQWAPVSDADSYNVYRSIVAGGTTAQVLTEGSELGYVGNTKGTKFTDSNIIPDFGKKPPRIYRPFSPGSVLSVTVTNKGSGYTSPPTVSFGASGAASGAVARAIINDAGEVVNIVVLAGGEGYNGTVVLSGGGGSGATATATVLPETGNYPLLSTIFQQRQIFAASINKPITIWGSQIRRYDNFNSSDIVLDTDSYEFELDSEAVSPIKHLLKTRGGLLAMTQENIWLVRGSSDEAITPTSALAEPQTYTGVSDLEPIRIGSSILYVEGKGYAVRTLDYNEVSRVYGGVDRSILSSHLFGEGKELVRWAYQESPYKVVWAVRADGVLLAFTTVEEEEVFAWTPSKTQGRFLDVVKSREGTRDRIYLVVERFINGRWTKFFEGLDLRQFTNVEDAWCVDCGLSLPMTTPIGTVTLHRSGSTYTATISGASWSSPVGKVLRIAGGIFTVTAVDGATVTLSLRKAATEWIPETDDTMSFPQPAGTWTLDSTVTSISGLDHLEGETVSILADGNVLPRQEVVNGSIMLSAPASRVIVGLRFTCRAKTLPLIVPDAGIEAKRKRVVAVSTRLQNSRGLKAGNSYDRVYPMKERTTENYGEAIELQQNLKRVSIGTTWDEDAQTCFLLDDPLPAVLLSLVQETEVGDEED